MSHFKIAYSENALNLFGPIPGREVISTKDTDYTNVAAVLITPSDIDILLTPAIETFDIPVFLINTSTEPLDEKLIAKVSRVVDLSPNNKALYTRQIESAADKFENAILPPFF